MLEYADDMAMFGTMSKEECYLEELQKVNLQIAHLQAVKENIERKLLIDLNLVTWGVVEEKGKPKEVITSVLHEGQQTLGFGRYKAEFKTLVNWGVDVNKYLELQELLRPKFNPIKCSVKYDVVNKIVTDIQEYGTKQDQKLFNEFMIKKYAKPSIKILANV